MNLDPFTIAVILTIVSISITVAMSAAWLHGGTAQGFGHIVAAQVVVPLGLVGLMINLINPGMVLVWGSYTLILAGTALIPIGMYRLLQRNVEVVTKWMVATVASGSFGLIFFAFVVDSVNARIILMSLWLAGILAVAARPMRGIREAMVARMFLWLFSLLMLFRAAYAWIMHVEATVFEADTVFHVLTFATICILSIGIPFAAMVFNGSLQARALREEKRLAEVRAQTMADFLARTSHELRTPLNSMIGQTELMIASLADSRQKARMKSLNHGAETLLKLVNDLLTFLQCESGNLPLEPRPTSLRETIRDCKRTFDPLASEAGVLLNFSVAEDFPRFVDIDELRVVQILNNLVGNAVKFAPGGEVNVALGSEKRRGKTWITLRVTDTGPGVAPDKIPDAFLPFSQINPSQANRTKGSGLGLAITRSLVDRLGGEIGMESTVGEGTTVWLRVPQEVSTTQPVQHSDRKITREVATQWEDAHVLHIDDNPANVEMLQWQLDHIGCRAVGTTSVSEALGLLQREYFDLILLDCQMPDMSGLELAQEVRRVPGPNKTVPILAVTADGSLGGRNQAIDSGMDDVLLKPIRLRGLRSALKSWIGETHYDDDYLQRVGNTAELERNMLAQVSDKVGLIRNLAEALERRHGDDKTTVERWTAVSQMFGLKQSQAMLCELAAQDETWTEQQLLEARERLIAEAKLLAASFSLDFPEARSR